LRLRPPPDSSGGGFPESNQIDMKYTSRIPSPNAPGSVTKAGADVKHNHITYYRENITKHILDSFFAELAKRGATIDDMETGKVSARLRTEVNITVTT